MQSSILLKPVEMTPEIMQMLEDRGLIIRLCPNHHNLTPKEDETKVETIYETAHPYGSHKLITVTVNRYEPAFFGTHPDNEDVFLIGDANTKPLWFIFSLHKAPILMEKIQNETITAGDFIVFPARYNEAMVSFFTVLKDAPHGECTTRGPGIPPSFYVTEPSDLPLSILQFDKYQMRIDEN